MKPAMNAVQSYQHQIKHLFNAFHYTAKQSKAKQCQNTVKTRAHNTHVLRDEKKLESHRGMCLVPFRFIFALHAFFHSFLKKQELNYNIITLFIFCIDAYVYTSEHGVYL